MHLKVGIHVGKGGDTTEGREDFHRGNSAQIISRADEGFLVNQEAHGVVEQIKTREERHKHNRNQQGVMGKAWEKGMGTACYVVSQFLVLRFEFKMRCF